MLSGELLQNCGKLIRKDIHPNLICEHIKAAQEVIEGIIESSCEKLKMSEKV